MTTKTTQEVESLLSGGDNIEFILQTVFHHVPARPDYFYDVGGKRVDLIADEFWWRSCALKDDMQHGEQGYLKVWWDGEKLTTLHTYWPPDNRSTQ